MKDKLKMVLQNIGLGFIFKVCYMILTYFTVSLLFKELGSKQYGFWTMIFSIANWIFYFDIGIGNSLRNKLTEKFLQNKVEDVKEYIISTYILMMSISVIIILISLSILNFLIKFNFVSKEIKLNKLSIIILLISTSISLTLNLYKHLYSSIHKVYQINLSYFILQLLVVLFILILTRLKNISILDVALIYSLVQIAVSGFYNFLFLKKYNIISKDFYKKIKFKRILELKESGISFFLIQLSLIVIFTTDNIIISKYFDYSDVSKYSIVSKLYLSIIMLLDIFIQPFWGLFTEAYEKKQLDTIKKILKYLFKGYILLSIGILVLRFISKYIFYYWIDKSFEVNTELLNYFCLFIILKSCVDISSNFLYGIGKIEELKFYYLIATILNIPLSIYFIKDFDFGIEGVILGTIISTIIILIPSIMIGYRNLR